MMQISGTRPIRFSGETVSPGANGLPTSQANVSKQNIDDLRQWLAQADQRHDDLVYKPVNAPSNSPISRGKSRLRQAVLPVLAMMAAFGIGGTAWTGLTGSLFRNPITTYSQNNHNRPRIHDNWGKLTDVAQTAKATKGFEDPALTGRFTERYNGFFYQLMEVLKENPGFLDQTLQQKLATAPDFRPHANMRTYGADFISFMKREINKQGVAYDPDGLKSELPGNDVINQVDIRGKFVNNLSELHLNDAQQTTLAEALKSKFKETVGSPLSSDFVSLFESASGTGVDGVTLKDFAGASSKADAVRLVKTTVENANNFKTLTPGEKEALVARSSEILGAVNSKAYDTVLLLILGTAALGAAGLAVVKHKNFIGLAQAVALDIPQGLRETTLIVNTANLNNPQVRQYLGNAFAYLNEQAKSAEALFRTSYRDNPEIQAQWKELKKTEQDLPTADILLEQTLDAVKAEFKKKITLADKWNDKPVDEIAFVQKLVEHFDEARESGRLFSQVGLHNDIGEPEVPADLSTIKDPIEYLKAKRGQLQQQFRDLRKGYLQFAYMALQVDARVNQTKASLNALHAEMAQKGANSTKELEEFGPRLVELNAKLEQEKKAKKEADELVLGTKLIIEDKLDAYRKYVDDLNNAILKHGLTQDLNKMRELAQQDLADPRLKEISDEVTAQHYVAETEAAERAEQERLKARVMERMATKAQTAGRAS